MGSEQIIEDEIAFKKRARRRLVGAIALVLLMVTILPMVLDDRNNQQPKPEIEITIPSESNQKDSESFAHQSIGEHPQAADKETLSGNTSQIDHEIEQAKAVQQQLSTSSGVVDAKPAETNLAASTSEVPAKPTISKQSPSKSELTADKANKPKQDKSTPEIKATSDGASVSTTTEDQVWVQVGVFSNQQKVQELQTKLNGLGIHTTVENIDSPKGVNYRLKTERYSQRSQAEKVLMTLKNQGINGMIKSK